MQSSSPARRRKVPVSKDARLKLLQLGQLANRGEEQRSAAIIAALRHLIGAPEQAEPFCFADLSCGEGWVALEVCSTYPSCSAVGWDAASDVVSRAIVQRQRRGLESRCKFHARCSVDIDLRGVDIVLMCPSPVGASFMLRRVLPQSGFSTGCMILSLDQPLPDNHRTSAFQWNLHGMLTGKSTVYCYSWLSQSLPLPLNSKTLSRSSSSTSNTLAQTSPSILLASPSSPQSPLDARAPASPAGFSKSSSLPSLTALSRHTDIDDGGRLDMHSSTVRSPGTSALLPTLKSSSSQESWEFKFLDF